MGRFDEETAVIEGRDGWWRSSMAAEWNIGANANGGYALSPVLNAFGRLTDHRDPLSVTTSFLRPVEGGVDADVRAEVIRVGRTTSVLRGSLSQAGRERLSVLATLGDLDAVVGVGPEVTVRPPSIPPPDECLDRRELAQGVDLPILSRLDVRIDPARAGGGSSAEAVMAGWIRFTDGADPTPRALPLFADAFPPSLYALVGRVGWVPTIELTVHVRRSPSAGWVQARMECDDLTGGRMIETGSLWDSEGRLVARARQLGLLLDR